MKLSIGYQLDSYNQLIVNTDENSQFNETEIVKEIERLENEMKEHKQSILELKEEQNEMMKKSCDLRIGILNRKGDLKEKQLMLKKQFYNPIMINSFDEYIEMILNQLNTEYKQTEINLEEIKSESEQAKYAEEMELK